MSDLSAVLDSLGHPTVLVLGDLILDRYTHGEAERISQEAPIVVLRASRTEQLLGGSANVCHMLRGLEAEVLCAGVIGDDEPGRTMRGMLAAAGIDHDLLLVDDTRPTTLKERFVGRAQAKHPSQILRVDHEVTTHLANQLEDQLIAGIMRRLPECDIVLVSDYSKGVCTPRVLQAVIQAAREQGIAVLVDPIRDGTFDRYRGATLIKPNRVEAERALGRKIHTSADAIAAGRQVCADYNAQYAVITLDSEGMALIAADGTGEVFPTQVRSVFDITGAGDMVLSTLGICLAGGVSPADAVRLANISGGLEVEHPGVVVLSRDEIRADILAQRQNGGHKIGTVDQAARLVEKARRQGKKIVFTNGCFDLLHVGHVTYLGEAAALGDLLIVGLNSDASVQQLKGPQRPVIREQDRASMLAALAAVSFVIIFDEETPVPLLEVLRPDVLVKGGTYQPEEVVGHELVTSYGGKVCLTGVVDGVSTTRILAKVSAAKQSTMPLRKAG
ncbi:MAG TPA: D-glycero-beta-D-manno-heptose 1-phosphate adenylyltransferase [Pirellulaceae bacterium]|nr:D-glycero-beta-D-manno-heptose 1-phosphate adenylyltransferase [Pirellulaceae bacterium]